MKSREEDRKIDGASEELRICMEKLLTSYNTHHVLCALFQQTNKLRESLYLSTCIILSKEVADTMDDALENCIIETRKEVLERRNQGQNKPESS